MLTHTQTDRQPLKHEQRLLIIESSIADATAAVKPHLLTKLRALSYDDARLSQHRREVTCPHQGLTVNVELYEVTGSCPGLH